MSDSYIEILLAVAGIYCGIGAVAGLVFVSAIPKGFDPDAAAGSRGFRVLILPGVIALWPLIVIKVAAVRRGRIAEGDAERPVSPERLRRNHGVAFMLLALIGPVLFAVALIWRAPRLEDSPPVDVPQATHHSAGEGPQR